MRDPHEIILEPVITEKGTLERPKGIYIFKVFPTSTKVDVKNAIEKLFNVDVMDVNTVNVKGKIRGTFGKGLGRTKHWKKAYVRIKKGQKIEALEAR